MRDPSPRAPFDQGLFLTHLNKGKELYEAASASRRPSGSWRRPICCGPGTRRS